MRYRHSQKSALMLSFGVICAVAALLGAFVENLGANRWWWIGVGAFLAVVMLVASQLTVTVDNESVTASFRWGWPRRRVDVVDITEVTTVTNSWWHGWGIRKVSRGWMYNVAGYDAIQLELRSGHVFRIGTDDPDALAAVVEAARQLN